MRERTGRHLAAAIALALTVSGCAGAGAGAQAEATNDAVGKGFPIVTPPAAESPSPTPSSSVPAATAKPIVKYSACSSGGTVTFTATYQDDFEFHHVFIDTDGDHRTGYTGVDVAGDFGADIMIENDLLFRSNGTEWSWVEVKAKSPLLSRSGDTYRWRLKAAQGRGRVVFNGDDGTTEVTTPVVTLKECDGPAS
ncbi:hypothetical protein FB565_006584 [Actinoplanes lutulentus]|uniref:Lipoprotein n=1 Tax=Actinoplanes lutulentus TaxID=1287878 RepID=A0A327ZBD3_9ACTN|nr:hypothetical protein [Actinoplanes lutulentus]MBB2946816.1 hypothetical protein [Actinoplanes lutulentus]RAK35708.1 hypothetical protein B0I29_109182 [Actinoplanes lutulentus]